MSLCVCDVLSLSVAEEEEEVNMASMIHNFNSFILFLFFLSQMPNSSRMFLVP